MAVHSGALEHAEFPVAGMSCASCAARVEQALRHAPDVAASRVAQALLATPVQFWSGWPFLVSAARRARHRSANMDTLIAIGTLSAFGYSVVALIVGGDLYFETAALLIAFLSLGRYL